MREIHRKVRLGERQAFATPCVRAGSVRVQICFQLYLEWTLFGVAGHAQPAAIRIGGTQERGGGDPVRVMATGALHIGSAR